MYFIVHQIIVYIAKKKLTIYFNNLLHIQFKILNSLIKE